MNFFFLPMSLLRRRAPAFRLCRGRKVWSNPQDLSIASFHKAMRDILSFSRFEGSIDAGLPHCEQIPSPTLLPL